MSYTINLSVLGSVFVLPSDIADKYIKMANEAQIKTALYIFRNSSAPIDPNVISKKIGKSAEAVEEALRYWASVGVLSAPEIKIADEKPVHEKERLVLPELPETKPSYEQIKKRCQESPELEMLFNEVQSKLGKTIGYDGQCVFLMMHDTYGLPLEVIFMLVDYCVSIGKDSYSYMKKMAKNWGEREIDSIEKAETVINDLTLCERSWKKLCALTGIQTPKPTSVQSEYLLRWTRDFNFTVEMIYLAYEIMADNCSKVSFKYMDSILRSWYEKGIKNPDDAEKERTKGKTESAKPSDASYDLDEFEKRAAALPVYKSKKGDKK